MYKRIEFMNKLSLVNIAKMQDNFTRHYHTSCKSLFVRDNFHIVITDDH